MVLHDAPNDLHKAGVIGKRSPASALFGSISSGMAYDDEAASVMGKRDSMYQLADEVELDEAFFPIRVPDEERDEPLKRGAGSQKKAKVLVIVESKPVDKILENYLHRKNTETMDKVASLAKASNRHTIKKVVYFFSI